MLYFFAESAFVCYSIYKTRERFLIFGRRKNYVKSKGARQQKTYTVAEIDDMLGIGRTSAYNLVKENHFKVVKIGASIRISKKSFDDWLDKLNI